MMLVHGVHGIWIFMVLVVIPVLPPIMVIALSRSPSFMKPELLTVLACLCFFHQLVATSLFTVSLITIVSVMMSLVY
jgi:hypothetical protein